MIRTASTRDIPVGEQVNLPGRSVVVFSNAPDGWGAVWYSATGVGPFYAKLPHGPVQKCLYWDERNGRHESWWDVHPDATGKTGEV